MLNYFFITININFIQTNKITTVKFTNNKHQSIRKTLLKQSGDRYFHYAFHNRQFRFLKPKDFKVTTQPSKQQYLAEYQLLSYEDIMTSHFYPPFDLMLFLMHEAYIKASLFWQYVIDYLAIFSLASEHVSTVSIIIDQLNPQLISILLLSLCARFEAVAFHIVYVIFSCPNFSYLIAQSSYDQQDILASDLLGFSATTFHFSPLLWVRRQFFMHYVDSTMPKNQHQLIEAFTIFTLGYRQPAEFLKEARLVILLTLKILKAKETVNIRAKQQRFFIYFIQIQLYNRRLYNILLCFIILFVLLKSNYYLLFIISVFLILINSPISKFLQLKRLFKNKTEQINRQIMPMQAQRLKSPKPNKIKIQVSSFRQIESKNSLSKQKYKKVQKNNKEVSQFFVPSKKSKEKDQPSELIKEIRKTFQDKINQLTKKYFKHNNGQNQFSSLQNISTSHIQADFELNEDSLDGRNKVSRRKQHKQQQHTLGYGSILRIYENGKSQQRLLSKKLQSISRIYEQQQNLLTQKFQSIISDIEFIQSRTLYFLQEEKHKHLTQCQIQEQIYDFILTLKKVKKNYIRKQNSNQKRGQTGKQKSGDVCRFSSEGELMKVLILNERGSQLMRRVKRIQDDLGEKYARVDKNVGMIVDLMGEFKNGELFLNDLPEQIVHQQQQQIQPNTQEPQVILFNSNHFQDNLNYEQKKLVEQINSVDQQLEPKYNNESITQEVQIEDDTLLKVSKVKQQIIENQPATQSYQQQQVQEGKMNEQIERIVDDEGKTSTMIAPPEDNIRIQQQHCVAQCEENMNEQVLHDKLHQIVAEIIPNKQEQHNQSSLNKQQQINTHDVEQHKNTLQNSINLNEEQQNRTVNQTIQNQNNSNEKQTPINKSLERDSIVQRDSIQVNSNGDRINVSDHRHTFRQLQLQQHRLSQFIHSPLQTTPNKDTIQASPIQLLSSKRSIKNLSSILKSNIHHVNFAQTQTRTNNLIPQPSSKTGNSSLVVNQTLQNPNKNIPKHNPYSGFFKSIQKITNKITNIQNEQYSINAFQYQSQPHNQIQQIHEETTFRNYKSEQQLPLYQQQFKDQTKNLNQSKYLSINSKTQLVQNPYTINLRHDYRDQRQLNRQMSMNELSSSRNNSKNICFGKLREQKLKFQQIKTSNYLIMQ